MTLRALARMPLNAAGAPLRCLLIGSAGSLLACAPDGPTVIQGAGPVIRERRVYRPIDSIEVRGYADLVIEALPLEPGALPESSGTDTVVYLEGAEDLLAWVETTLSGDTLTIAIRDGARLDPLPSIEVQTSYLVSVASIGSGDIQLRGLTRRSTRRDALTLQITGSAEVEAQGAIDELAIEHRGSGNLDLRGLQVRHASYSGNGSGEAHVFAKDSLQADLRGSGHLFIYGTVPEAKVVGSVLGSAEISRAFIVLE